MPSKRLKNFNKTSLFKANKAKDVQVFTIEEILSNLLDNYKINNSVKFPESIDLSFNMGLDYKNSSNVIKSFVDYNYGLSKSDSADYLSSILFFLDGDQAEFAKSLGFVNVFGKTEIQNFKSKKDIKKYNLCVVGQDLLSSLGSISRLLGPRGIMPNQKVGTVVAKDIKIIQLFKDVKRFPFYLSKDNSIKLSFGSFNLTKEQNLDNFKQILNSIKNARPSSFKGSEYIKSCFINSTMGPSFRLNLSTIYSL